MSGESSPQWLSIEGDQARCMTCGELLPGSSAKQIKQHQKSKTHKKYSKDGPHSPKGKKSTRKTPREITMTNEEDEISESEECILCSLIMQELDPENAEKRARRVHCIDEYRKARAQGENVFPCFPPPMMWEPKDSFPGCRTPFMTIANANLPDGVPDSLDDCLNQYCNIGVNSADKPPNVDIGGENKKMKSLSQAGRELMRACESKTTYWAAFVVDSIEHPLWWPRPKRNGPCVDHGDVPDYNQVIVGNTGTDIGIHIDNAKEPCDSKMSRGVNLEYVDSTDPQVQHCLIDGAKSVHVNTYFTAVRGQKKVIMLPPHQNIFDKDAKFPEDIDADLLHEIVVQHGGYYYTLEPISSETALTVFTPAGWHHWLLGLTDWHCIFGASRFSV